MASLGNWLLHASSGTHLLFFLFFNPPCAADTDSSGELATGSKSMFWLAGSPRIRKSMENVAEVPVTLDSIENVVRPEVPIL